MPTDKLFTGQRLDSTGLYYYNARYYDPAIGRFISADTIVPKPTNPQELNRYAYCLNNPLRYIDPTGHQDEIGWRNVPSMSPPPSSLIIITVSGQFNFSGEIPNNILNQFYPEIPDPDIQVMENATGGQQLVSGAPAGAGLLAAVDQGLYNFSWLRTTNCPQTVVFKATLSFNPTTGIADYELKIRSSYPKFFTYTPLVGQKPMKLDAITSRGSIPLITAKVVTMSAQTENWNESYRSSAYIPGVSQTNRLLGLNDPRATFVSKASINLQINAAEGSAKGINIDFGSKNWHPY